MTMRLALIHVGQESNDFNPLPTTLRDYEAFGIYQGAEILQRLRGVGEVGGWVDAIEADGRPVEIVPIVRAWAVAGGRIDAGALGFFERRIREGLAAAGRMDGYRCSSTARAPHTGSTTSTSTPQIALCREILARTCRSCCRSITTRTSPSGWCATRARSSRTARSRTDPYDTGAVSARLLLRIVAGEVRPVTAFRKLPLLSHQEQFLTARAAR